MAVAGRRQPVRWSLLILLCTWSLSYVAMIVRLAPPLEQNGAEALVIHLIGWTTIALIAADGLRSFDDLLRVCKVLVALVAAVSVVGMLQFVGVNSVVDLLTSLPGLTVNGVLSSVEQRGSFNRVAGTMAHPIEFATLVALTLPIALQLIPWVDPEHRRRWQLAAALIAIGIPISLSRSGFLGLVVGLVVLFLAWDNRRRLRVLAAVLVLGLLFFVAVPGLLGTIGGYLTAGNSDSSIATRTSDYAAVSPYIDADPVIGRGLGTFTPPTYRILDNQYLMTLIETGILGLVAFTLALLVPALAAYDAWASSGNPLGRDLARGIFAADLVVLVSVGAFDALSFWGFSGTAFLVFGLSGACFRLARSGRSAVADVTAPC